MVQAGHSAGEKLVGGTRNCRRIGLGLAPKVVFFKEYTMCTFPLILYLLLGLPLSEGSLNMFALFPDVRGKQANGPQIGLYSDGNAALSKLPFPMLHDPL